MRRVRDGRARAHRRRNCSGLSQRPICRTCISSRLHVQFDAVGALCRQGDSHGHQLFVQHVDPSWHEGGLSNSQKAFITSGAFSSSLFNWLSFFMSNISRLRFSCKFVT
jgi:hypothetical protein